MDGTNERLDRAEQMLADMAARQHYHDEALERFDARMNVIAERLDMITERLDTVSERLDELTERVNHLGSFTAELTSVVRDTAVLVKQNTLSIERNTAHIFESNLQIQKLSEAWLFHNKRINDLEDRHAS
jgi:chromosome segregation ATPase